MLRIREVERAVLYLSLERPDTRTPEGDAPIRQSVLCLQAVCGSAGRLCGPTRYRALLVMTHKISKQPACPHRGVRIPSRIGCFRLPRQTKLKTRLSRKKNDLRRIRHGIARAIESLRRVWLPLVPHSKPWDCLLQVL